MQRNHWMSLVAVAFCFVATPLQAERNTRPEDLLGTWNITIKAEGQLFEHVAGVTQEGETLKVEYMTDEFGDHEAVDVKLNGNELAFMIVVESPEGGIKLKIKTTVAGDRLDGEVEYQVGDITGTTEFKGEREALDTEEDDDEE